MTQITCETADLIRTGLALKPLSSITNYVSGEVLNPALPPITSTTWGTDQGALLRDDLDADGCRHWLLNIHDPRSMDYLDDAELAKVIAPALTRANGWKPRPFTCSTCDGGGCPDCTDTP